MARRVRSSEPMTNEAQGIPRRHFLEVAAAIGLSTSGWSALAEDVHGLGEEVRQQEDLFVVNMLGGIVNLNPLVGGGRLGLLDPRSIADAIDSGMRAVNVTVGGFARDTPASFDPTLTQVIRWTERVRSHPDSLVRVLNASDIERARGEGKVGVIFGFQNAVMMGDDGPRSAGARERRPDAVGLRGRRGSGGGGRARRFKPQR